MDFQSMFAICASNQEEYESDSENEEDLQVGSVFLYGVKIISLTIEKQERLCLAQISNTLLKAFSYNEIHNRRVALGITCIQCTPAQLEILRRAGAMPASSRRCGMITRREAERLCNSFLANSTPPRLPEDFTFMVYHECAWGCKGIFMPSRYNSSRAKCIKCTICGIFFSPNKFIFHSHRIDINDKYTEPDAANFNSWRRHMKLLGNPSDDVIHSWEDVKAMFNGGTRKRISLNGQTKSSYDSSQNMRVLEKKNYKPVTHVPMTGLTSKYFETQRKVSSYSDITLKLTGRGVFDYVLDQNASYNEENFEKSHKYSVFTCLPWITKRNSIRLNCSTKSLCSGETGSPQIVSAFNDQINKSAFQPVISNSFDEMKIQTSVQSLKTSVPLQHKAEPIVTDDEIDVETIDIQLKKKHYSSDYLSSTKIEHGALDLFQKSRNIGNNFIKIDTTYLNNMHEHKEAFHNEHKEIFENYIRLNNTLSVVY
ncbi:ski-like protein [Trichogramma pretiosum]|uniref:ski-like protein n=1 Tax=Trichogramma pretiosum TaxID=7493 RepID=UPI000C719178|nr:ski-like protein [Trichogramma pretiosum]